MGKRDGSPSIPDQPSKASKVECFHFSEMPIEAFFASSTFSVKPQDSIDQIVATSPAKVLELPMAESLRRAVAPLLIEHGKAMGAKVDEQFADFRKNINRLDETLDQVQLLSAPTSNSHPPLTLSKLMPSVLGSIILEPPLLDRLLPALKNLVIMT